MSRPTVARVGIAGLERAARYAGESFGHEDVAGASHPASAVQLRALWWLAALTALIGLTALALR